MRTRLTCILICLLVILSGCTSETKNGISSNNENDYLYDLYVYSNGDVISTKIDLINEKTIKHESINNLGFKKKSQIVGTIEPSYKYNKVFCSIYRTGSIGSGKMGKKLVVLKDGNIDGEVKFENNIGPDRMICDDEKEKLYVLFVLQPSSYNPEGTPMKIVNTSNNQIIKSMNLKGCFSGYDFRDNYIYTTVSSATALGYKDLTNSYLARINRDTNKIDIINKDFKYSPTDIKVWNNKLYMLNNYNPFENEKDEHRILIFDLNGKYVNSVNIEPWSQSMIIDKNDLAYINHIGKVSSGDFDGDTITVFDTNVDKVVGKITGFTGCSGMAIQDDYLFVSNYQDSSISVVDIRSRKIIGNIKLGKGNRPEKIVVLKKKR